MLDAANSLPEPAAINDFAVGLAILSSAFFMKLTLDTGTSSLS